MVIDELFFKKKLYSVAQGKKLEWNHQTTSTKKRPSDAEANWNRFTATAWGEIGVVKLTGGIQITNHQIE